MARKLHRETKTPKDGGNFKRERGLWMKKIILGLLIAGGSLYAEDPMAWMYEDHGLEVKKIKEIEVDCVRPIKMRVINDNQDVSRYNNELHKYETCIKLFIYKQNTILSKEKNADKRKAIQNSIRKANQLFKAYDTTNDLEQNQHYGGHSSRIDGLGYDRKREEEQKKLEKMN